MSDRQACFRKNVNGFLNQVFNVYGGYNANELETITSKEFPWQKARNGCAPGSYSRNPIALKDMRDYYGGRIGKCMVDFQA